MTLLYSEVTASVSTNQKESMCVRRFPRVTLRVLDSYRTKSRGHLCLTVQYCPLIWSHSRYLRSPRYTKNYWVTIPKSRIQTERHRACVPCFSYLEPRKSSNEALRETVNFVANSFNAFFASAACKFSSSICAVITPPITSEPSSVTACISHTRSWTTSSNSHTFMLCASAISSRKWSTRPGSSDPMLSWTIPSSSDLMLLYTSSCCNLKRLWISSSIYLLMTGSTRWTPGGPDVQDFDGRPPSTSPEWARRRWCPERINSSRIRSSGSRLSLCSRYLSDKWSPSSGEEACVKWVGRIEFEDGDGERVLGVLTSVGDPSQSGCVRCRLLQHSSGDRERPRDHQLAMKAEISCRCGDGTYLCPVCQ